MSDLISVFGFSSILTVILLLLNLVHLFLEKAAPDSVEEKAISWIMIVLFFCSLPSSIIFYFVLRPYGKKMFELGKSESEDQLVPLMNAYDRSSKEYQESYESAMDTIHWLRSEITVLKESVEEWENKYNTLMNEKAPIDNPNAYKINREYYQSGYDEGRRRGYFDGYIDCHHDITNGTDRTNDILDMFPEWKKPSDSPKEA